MIYLLPHQNQKSFELLYNFLNFVYGVLLNRKKVYFMYDFLVNIIVVLLFALPFTIIYLVVKRNAVAKKIVFVNVMAGVAIFLFAVMLDIFGLVDTGSDTQTQQTASNNVSSSESKKADSTPSITYEDITVNRMIQTLEDNALKAETQYNDAYLNITGRLCNIDSDGKYITLDATYDDWVFTRVTCYVTDKEQLNKIMEMSIGNTVRLSGQVTAVGEILGYNLDIHEIY